MNDSVLDILMITYNQPRYTRLSLERLLDTCDKGMHVWVWHNGNDAETLEVVHSFARHPHLKQIYISSENKKLREPTNWFWENSDAPFLAKVDNDCLVPDGWANTLIEAHNHNPELGLLACWEYHEDDYVVELAERKLRNLYGGQQILLNCWVPGSGYVMKRKLFEQLGKIRPDESFTSYGIRAAKAGWINGWHFPFLCQEHMDDPRSPYTRFRCEDDFLRDRPLSAIVHNVNSLEEWKDRVRWIARYVQAAPYDPSHFIGWRAKLRRGMKRLRRIVGCHEPWREEGRHIARKLYNG